MKIPIFEEIQLIDLNTEKMRIIVSDSKIGKVPCYINLSNLDKTTLKKTVSELEEMMNEYNLSYDFPYPLYIISPFQPRTNLPWSQSVRDLPEHYFKKVKRPNNKEINLINKLSIKIEKIKNLNIFKSLEEFKKTSKLQRKLYNETLELHFLEKVESKILKKAKK